MRKASSESKSSDRQIAIEAIKQAAEKWPSTFVARSKLGVFTGGLIAPGTAANEDSRRTGIRGAFKIGRNVAYPTTEVVNWLLARLEV